MRSLLIGNGIDIQFGGKDYLNRNIIKRAVENLYSDIFNPEAYPKEIGQWFVHLYCEFTKVLKGEYNQYIATSYDKKFIKDLNKRYKKKKKYKYTEIGIEDYLFIHDLFCRKNRIFNPEQFVFRETFKRWILDSIYNNGKINDIHDRFPMKLKEFFSSYDNIFTTNYDTNITKFSGQDVYYLHGAFHILSYIYDKDSFRNKLSDSPVKECPVIEGCEHLFSTALMSFTGELKSYSMDVAHNSNEAITKFAEGMELNPDIAKDIETWKDDSNYIVRNMYEAIMLKRKDKGLVFKEQYPIEKFKSIKEQIDLVGLSPTNDTHLFELINKNDKINTVCFYYFDKRDIPDIRKAFNKKKIVVLSIKECWLKYQ